MRTRVEAHAPRMDQQMGNWAWGAVHGGGGKRERYERNRMEPAQPEPRVQPGLVVLPSPAARRLLV